MKEIIMDTSFILTCIKQKIDFFEELIGFKIIIPLEVIKEIEGLSISNSSAQIALALLNKANYQKINFGKGIVDELLINFAKKNPLIIIATLDKEIKKSVKNEKMVIRGRKKLEVI